MLKKTHTGLQTNFRSSALIAAGAALLMLFADTASPAFAQKAAAVQNYGSLPMSFEVNRGQSAKQVKFLARGSGYRLFLTGQEAVLTLHTAKSNAQDSGTKHLSATGIGHGSSASPSAAFREQKSSAPGKTAADLRDSQDRLSTDVLHMQIAGANFRSDPEGVDPLPGVANYFIGSDPAKWHTNIATYRKVRYTSVYPGIDLVYYGNQNQLEYDFVAAPGANIDPIRLHFAGATNLALAHNGDLQIVADKGSVTFKKPVIYQLVHGLQKPVDGSFKLLAGNTVSFKVGRYDHSKELVIDPVLSYSSYLGGTAADFVVGAAAGPAGTLYVTGETISEDFPLSPGAFQSVNEATPSNAVGTAFVSKFNDSGTALLYSTYLGGVAVSETVHNQGDYGHGIAVDASGDAFVTGWTYSTNFPITAGAYQSVSKTQTRQQPTGFVTKLNPSGTGLLYSTYLGGSFADELTSIAVDGAGDAFISGLSFSNDFPTTAGVIQATNRSYSTGGSNQIVTKLNSSGSALLYSTYLGGTHNDPAGSVNVTVVAENAVAVDSLGDAYVIGFTGSSDFPVTSGAFQTINRGIYNITVSKLNPTATGLIYSTYIGGSQASFSEGLAVDGNGNAYVSGYTYDPDFPVTVGAFQTQNKAYINTNNDGDSLTQGFLAKVTADGSGLVYSTYLGGTTGPWGGDSIYGVAVDSAGDAFVTGAVMSNDFPVTSNAYQSANRGATHCCDYLTYTSDSFLTEFSPDGSSLLYSTYFGGSGTQNPQGPGGFGDSAYGMTIGSNGAVYLVGYTSSYNFPTTGGAVQTSYHSTQNMGFVAAFNFGIPPTTASTRTALASSSNPAILGTSVTFTAAVTPASGNVVPTGNVVFSVDEATVATVSLDATGTATYTPAPLAPGAHYVLASYAGNSTYSASGNGLTEIIQPVTPVISPATGTYTSQQIVTIASPTPGALLYYTLDGTTPSVFTTLYAGPITVNATRTVTAVAVSANNASSAIAQSTITIVGSPSVLAGPATAITTSTATLNAFVNSMGLTGTYAFRYGTSSAALTANTTATNLSASTARVQAVASLTGLQNQTTYYYQVVVTTAGGTVAGAVQSFTAGAGNSPHNSDPVAGDSPSLSVNVASLAALAGGRTQITTATSAFVTPLGVLVRDSSGNPVAGVTVNFTAPSGGASATLNTNSVVTAANGIATVTASANASAGNYSVTASVNGVSTKAVYSLGNTDFTLAADSASFNLARGSATSGAFTVASLNGFASSVTLACTNLPTGVTCSFAPSTVTPVGGKVTSVLTLNAARNASVTARNFTLGGGGAVFALCLLGSSLCRRRKSFGLLALLALGFVLTNATGCATSVTSPAPFSSAVTVTATSGTLVHTQVITLNVR